MKKNITILLLLLMSYSVFSETYQQYTKRICQQYDVPYEIAYGIATVESNWRNIEGATGDIGIFQLNPNYIEYFADMYWEKSTSFDPWNPTHNIEIGVAYLRCLYERNNYDWMKAIMAYNIGNYALHFHYEFETWQYEVANIYYFKVLSVINKM